MLPIFYIKKGNLSFGSSHLLIDIELYIYPGDRICLIGRNGSGKSSLMKLISKEYELDNGDIFRLPSVNVGYLKQDIKLSTSGNIYDFVSDQPYIDEYNQYKIDIILNNLKLDGKQELSYCSGGQLRRAFLAKALIEEPEILLLDEPTNHLDIETIEWLEEYIYAYGGAIICISHDRAFLANTTNKVWWIDRGILRTSNSGFKYFDSWQEEVIQQEEIQLGKMGKKLELENDWLSKGVTARRKRNQKRLKDLFVLRSHLQTHNDKLSKAKQKLNVELGENTKKANFIIEANNISFGYNEELLINNFSFRVKKGEKIGVIGPNGAGKSTFINILIGNLKATSGTITYGHGLDISFIDQNRSFLNPNHSIKEVLCPEGGDQIFFHNKVQHVAAYLKQFMFDPKSLNDKVSTLSGGQASRLLLAKTFIKPGNLLILDEPTNDLDMDSLEVLLEILSEYSGTLLIVSHDRDFLDRLVTRTLVFMPGKIIDLSGGYEDYKRLVASESLLLKNKPLTSNHPTQSSKTLIIDQPKSKKDKEKKLSYKFQRALETIPEEIDKIEKRAKEIEKFLNDNNNLFLTNSMQFNKLTLELSEIKEKIDHLTEQWIEIDNL